MSESPNQTFIIQLPSSLARRITAVVDYEDAPYASISEFVKVAAENQLILDSSVGIPSASSGPSDHSTETGLKDSKIGHKVQRLIRAPQDVKADLSSSNSSAVPEKTVSTSDLLRIPNSLPSIRNSNISTGHALTALTNRLSPLLAGPRVLANLTEAIGSPPKVDAFTEAGARAARNLGLLLRNEDDVAGRRGRLRRSTAWPVGDDEAKSLIRYRNSFMLSSDGKSAVGPLVDFQFVSVEGADVYLTEVGAAIAIQTIPAIDTDGAADLMTENLRRLFSKSLVQIPGELKEIRFFLEAVEQTRGAQDQVDNRISTFHSNWSEAQVVSHRAAMIGRLRDLAVIDVDSVPKTTIVEGADYQVFISLLN